MKKKIFIVGLLALLVFAGTTFAAEIMSWQETCSGRLEVEWSLAGNTVTCFEEGAPTDTPIPPTDTPEPNGHDDTTWHSVSAEMSHTHNVNPNSVAHIFGPISDYLAQEISYPWETSHENEIKHEGYKWHAAELPGCVQLGGQNPNCIVAWRIEHHAVGGSVGANTALHSFYAELNVCTPDLLQCGIIRQGGHVDYGFLRTIVTRIHIPIPADSTSCQTVATGAPYREHEPMDIAADDNKIRANWNATGGGGCHQGIGFAFHTRDDWQGIDLSDPTRLELYCPAFDCEFNHSTELFYHIDIDGSWLAQFDVGGVANFNGKVDRFGNVVDSGCVPSPDCAPLIIENVPLGDALFRDGIAQGELLDFDISPSGEFWIEYPN